MWPEAEFDEARFQHGSAVAAAYLEQAKNTVSAEALAALTIPVTYVVINAALRGAVYLPANKFGSTTKTFTE